MDSQRYGLSQVQRTRQWSKKKSFLGIANSRNQRLSNAGLVRLSNRRPSGMENNERRSSRRRSSLIMPLGRVSRRSSAASDIGDDDDDLAEKSMFDSIQDAMKEKWRKTAINASEDLKRDSRQKYNRRQSTFGSFRNREPGGDLSQRRASRWTASRSSMFMPRATGESAPALAPCASASEFEQPPRPLPRPAATPVHEAFERPLSALSVSGDGQGLRSDKPKSESNGSPSQQGAPIVNKSAPWWGLGKGLEA